MATHSIEVIDSHTGGEPTRVVIAGGPDLGSGPLAERRERFRARARPLPLRRRQRAARLGRRWSARCSCEPDDPTCAAGVIFFNNVGYLGMCGHGTIGLVVTLAHLGRIAARRAPHRNARRRRHRDAARRTATSSVANVASYRIAQARRRRRARPSAPVTGDVAWGGNWFFLVAEHGQELDAGQRRATRPTFTLARRGRRVNGAGRRRTSITSSCSARRLAPTADSRELRPLPGQGLRPLALRHRHQREARLPRRRRQARRRRARGGRRASSAARFAGTFRWLDRATGRIAPTITGTRRSSTPRRRCCSTTAIRSAAGIR